MNARRVFRGVKNGFALALLFAAPMPLVAQLVVPASHTLTPPEGTAQGGSYDYFDDTGTQLTDGIFGGNRWFAYLGHGPAYEWVAWRVANPTLTFAFLSSVAIQPVAIGFNRGSGGGVFLPNNVTIAGPSFTLTGNEFADNLRQNLVFTLASPFVGNLLTINLSDGNVGTWIFVDEVPFTAVPEPGAAWTIGLAGGAAGWRRGPWRVASKLGPTA